MEQDKRKIIKYKIIFSIIICLTIFIAIFIALWYTGALKEIKEKYFKEKATTTKSAQNSVTVTIEGIVPTFTPITMGTLTIVSTTEELMTTVEDITSIQTQSATPSQTTEPVQNATTQVQMTKPVQNATTQVAFNNSTGKFNAQFKSVNLWDGHCQYELTVSNTSTVNISSWKISTKVPSGSIVSNSWNCICSIDGDTLTVLPVDYNSAIGAGQSVNNIGIILEGSNLPSTIEYNGTASGSASSNNSGSSTEQNTTASNIPDTNYDSYTPPKLESGTPLSNHGKLAVVGTSLVDNNGNKFQLKGVSTHGITWFPQYVNREAFKTLRDDWGANAVRLALYTAEYNGYCSGGNQAELKKIIENGVSYATELGMYVIIDWHILSDGNPNTNKAAAISFFSEMAQKYKDYDNVIYEICNEPNGGVDWNTVKSYADDVISVIRKYDSDAIILVGTPTWSQEVDKVAANPVSKPDNVMYVLHFYAATHKDDLRNRLKNAVAAGTPVFISEFSICDASGNGGIDYASANEWKKMINSYNISYIGWNLSNKAETSSLINSSCSKTSGWTTAELTETGKWLRNFIAGY